MKPRVVLSNARNQCLTFFWPGESAYYVGYRFVEGVPEQSESPLDGIERLPTMRSRLAAPAETTPLPPAEADPFGKGWAATCDEPNEADPIRLRFRAYADGSAWASGRDNNGAQSREFLFQPAENGVVMQMKLTTTQAVHGAFVVQQCLRFSGETNQEWRRPIACIPFLSEFDMQATGRPNDAITYARQNDQWVKFPVQRARRHTRPGRALVGATQGEVDHGLIVRESLDGAHASGMYWERTAYVSNRHPADCLHAYVDFGPLEPGAERSLHGKFYLLAGTKDELLEMWKQEFVAAPR